MRSILFIAAAGLALSGCGEKLSGAYLPSGKPPAGIGFVYEKIEFGSGETADISFMGMTLRASYKLDAKKVILTADGKSIVLALDDKGCLDGGQMLGRYCKK